MSIFKKHKNKIKTEICHKCFRHLKEHEALIFNTKGETFCIRCKTKEAHQIEGSEIEKTIKELGGR